MFLANESDIYQLRAEGKISMTQAIDHLEIFLMIQTVIDSTDELFVKVNRSGIFTKALALYKSVKHDLSLLNKSLIIEFSGKDGVCWGFKERLFRGSTLTG